MMNLTASSLIDACRDDGQDAGISMRATLDPLSGLHGTVKPATYAGGVFQEDVRWWGSPPERTVAILIDNVPSQANRLEAELQRLRADLGLPEVVLDLSAVPYLPPHLPRQLSSFRFPHRQADAYLRDAMSDGVPFSRTATGKALLDATADSPTTILGWFPQALLFGFWQSHLGSKRSQAKLARSWVSEIVGYDPATSAGERAHPLGLKGDELNLSIGEQVESDENDLLGRPWSIVEGSRKEKAAPGKSRKALSEIGHGQVPIGGGTALSGVSFRVIEQQATVSFSGLRRLHFGGPDRSAAARALLAALGLVAHVAAFGRAFGLRSGCDLRPAESTWRWLGSADSRDVSTLNLSAAIALFQECRAAAASAALLEGGGWGEAPVRLTPSESLASAIAKSWPLAPLDA
jgi:CRISPR-associated protein Csb1